MRTLTVLRFSPYQLDLRFPYDEDLKNYIKQFPGAYFDQPEEGAIGPRRWIFPRELLPQLQTWCLAHSWSVSAPWDIEEGGRFHRDTYFNNPSLHPHQHETIKQALWGLDHTSAWLINLAMRMGKTACAIEVCRLLGLNKVAIICPAMVRGEWLRELQKWWPERASTVFVWKPGLSKKALEEAKSATTHIVSYGQVSNLSADFQPEIIIADEIHYLQNPATQQAKAVYSLASANPGALRLGLTGTVVSTHLESMHSPLNFLWPNRFGTKGGFKYRYLESEEVYDKRGIKRGLKYGKPRQDTAEELRLRLSTCSTRRTKADCPTLFPPLATKLLQPDSAYTEAVALAQSIIDSGESVGVYAYERAEAKKLAKVLDCPVITGDEAASQRDSRIEDLRSKAKEGPVVFAATISATSTGINLSFCNNFIYTQLSDKIYELVQSFARGHVMGGRSVMIYLMVDEAHRAQAERVQRKINAVNELISAGVEEQQLAQSTNLLKDKGYSDEEWSSICKLMLSESFDDGSTITEE